MAYITVGEENGTPIDLYYEDHGKGKPVVLIHGFPLDSASWEKQVTALLAAEHRVITYDRRGAGKSSQPTIGYEYDTFAKDLHMLMTKLDLSDAALVGFSMGTGEVVRYLGTYGSDRVRKAVLISSVPPFMVKTDDNPDGMDGNIFEDIKKSIRKDRLAFLSVFLTDFYNFDVLGGKRVSDQVVQYNWNVGAAYSPQGTHDCVTTWMTDFRKDIPAIDVPTLIIHGKADRTLPITVTGIPLSKIIKGARFLEVEGAPHGLIWTHADEVNPELLEFLK